MRQHTGAAVIATRLLLIAAGGTAAMRGGRFPHPDDPLGPLSVTKRRALPAPATGARLVSGPARAARETAALVGASAEIEPALADIDHGEWAGLSFDAVGETHVAAWIAAPHRGAPGGEPLAAVMARVSAWLGDIRSDGGVVIAVTHAAIVRAAVAVVLGIDPAATSAIDVAPLAQLRLSHHDRWRIQELRRA